MSARDQKKPHDNELVEAFLDEFMEIEYHGRVHHLARAHYREVFTTLLPKWCRKEGPVPNAGKQREEA